MVQREDHSPFPLRSREPDEVARAYAAHEGGLAGSFFRVIGASAVWAALWVWSPPTLAVWALMLFAYLCSLGVVALIDVVAHHHAAGYLEWRRRFFRTAGWVVLSGFVGIAWFLVYLVLRHRI
jgi:hypothetical protein